MKYNKENTNEEIIKINEVKYLFIGFIVGIVPFILLITALSIKEGGIEFIPSILRNTILSAGIIVSLINAVMLKYIISNKIKASVC